MTCSRRISGKHIKWCIANGEWRNLPEIFLPAEIAEMGGVSLTAASGATIVRGSGLEQS